MAKKIISFVFVLSFLNLAAPAARAETCQSATNRTSRTVQSQQTVVPRENGQCPPNTDPQTNGGTGCVVRGA